MPLHALWPIGNPGDPGRGLPAALQSVRPQNLRRVVFLVSNLCFLLVVVASVFR